MKMPNQQLLRLSTEQQSRSAGDCLRAKGARTNSSVSIIESVENSIEELLSSVTCCAVSMTHLQLDKFQRFEAWLRENGGSFDLVRLYTVYK